MIAFLDKYKKWIIGFIIALLVLVFINAKLSSDRWRRQYDKLTGQLEVLDKQFKDYQKETSAKYKAIDKQLKDEQELRSNIDKERQKIALDKLKLQAELAKEKAKDAIASPNEILVEINKRIQGEAKLLASGVFEFTKQGALFTLTKFREGEFCLADSLKQKEDIAKLEEKVISHEKSLKGLETKFQLNNEEKLKILKAYNMSIERTNALEKSFKWSRIKYFGYGVGFTLIAETFVSLFKK